MPHHLHRNNFFLVSNLNLFYLSLRPFPQVFCVWIKATQTRNVSSAMDLSLATMAGLEWVDGGFFMRWLSRAHSVTHHLSTATFSAGRNQAWNLCRTSSCAGEVTGACVFTAPFMLTEALVCFLPKAAMHTWHGCCSENAACMPARFNALLKLNKEKITLWVDSLHKRKQLFLHLSLSKSEDAWECL